MRPQIDWMTQTDDRILELLADSGLILSPAVIARNLDYSRSWISVRLSELSERDLIDSEDDGYYWITERGHAYLDGDIGATELE